LGPEDIRHPVSLGITDETGRGHLIEATRALGDQLNIWEHPPLNSVILTHAHFGHVDGLGLFGRETLNARGLDLYASTSMLSLIEQTPQWSLMVEQGVFSVVPTAAGSLHSLSPDVRLEAVQVPHRAELSDMHAFIVRGPNQSVLFLPDHDRWDDTLAHHHVSSIREWLSSLRVDIALVDGTFWSANELSGRRQDEVPHPTVSETLERLGPRVEGDPHVVFIHLNHTNPLHEPSSPEHQTVIDMGWTVGEQGMTFTL
jgi:pyrroloquinoline quinone biosynthesis protein B